jgi:predicted ATPase
MRIDKNYWYAVAGGPSSGKTTLVNELAKRGFQVYSEAARALIAREMSRGCSLEEI